MKKIIIIILASLLSIYILLWVFSIARYDTTYGVSYSPQYARHLGLDSDKTYDAILNDLKPSIIRLSVPWSLTEREEGVFDFSEIDILIEKAGKANTKVTLTVGQKAPRWPECYIPSWVSMLSEEKKKEKLLRYVKTVVLRYKDNSSLEYWQVENEPFINFSFGECKDFEPDFVKDEIRLVREFDPSRFIMITDSGELSTFRKASLAGDILGTTVYRTVRTPKDFLVSYDWLPPAFYTLRARLWSNDFNHFFVSELQAEPWLKSMGDISTDNSFSLKRFDQNVNYVERIGASRAYLWGVEWWYFMKEKKNDASFWNKAREIMW